MSKKITIKSVITCIHCGHKKEEIMPQYTSQTAYKCNNCGVIITVKQGDCCIYCTYGSVPCPAAQRTG
ncbi:MAG: GDCCVxC domain-containing (seleno)protein [Bacteroidota bacterium]